MNLKLQGKIALVGGASRGIGLGVATSLLNEGSLVILVARDAAALDQTVADLGDRARVRQLLDRDVGRRLVDQGPQVLQRASRIELARFRLKTARGWRTPSANGSAGLICLFAMSAREPQSLRVRKRSRNGGVCWRSIS